MLLLDSQVVLWVVSDNPALGPGARRLIARSPFVHVSAATFWELTIKAMLGKLTLPDELEEALHQQSLVSLPVTAAHTRAITRFPELVRHDPFDRLLMAQASVESMSFLTADHLLLSSGHPFVLDATR